MAPERQPTDVASSTNQEPEASGRATEPSTPFSEESVKPPTIPPEPDTVEVERPTPGCPIVGLVASAGGLSAFRDFFTAMPAVSGAAFVVIPHLDPTHESLMVELIGRQMTMPVVEATEGLNVEADHVYVLPPNKYMTMSGGALRLTGPVERHGMQTSIDLFLRSLADDKREKAICIVLSGTGAHGTLGLKAVKAAGGMAMVQDPKTAEYSAMPQNAVATGLADFVLPVAQMPAALIGYIRRFFAAEAAPVSDEELTTANGQLQEKVADLESANNDLANLLRCSEAAIVFLDSGFRIKRYTPHATKLFGLIPTDLERPLSQISPNFADDALHRDIEQVYRSLTAIEKPVRTSDGTWWNRRIAPYRTGDDRIDGVVLTFYDVTRVRVADEQVRRLAAVLRDSNDAVIVHDFDGKVTAWNRGAEQMLGYTEAEALAMNCRRFVPEEIDEFDSYRERLRRGERVEPWEAQRRTKDGRVLDVFVSATTLKDEEGRSVAVAKTERDVTEHKQARLRLEDEIRLRTADLRKSQEHLIAVLDSAGDAIITIDAQGIIQSVNKSAERIFGYPAGEMVGQNVKLLMPSPHCDEHDRYLAEFGRTGKSKILAVAREVIARRKDGSLFPAEVTVNAVDHLGFFTGVLRDITQRKQAETALSESERFARSTLDGLSAHVAIVDDRGIILAVNQAWKDFATANEAVATKVQAGADYLRVCERNAGLPAGEGSTIAAGIRAVLEGKTSEFLTEYSCHGPQEQHWFLMRVTPFPGEGPRRVVIAHEDISKRKELEREVVEIASLEQRRIGQDLHDSVGQELTALGMLVGDLARAVQTDPASVMSRIERIGDILKSSRKELRAVLRGLLPVAVDTEGLMASLSDLADRIRDEGKSNCVFDCPDPVAVADNLVATHLYLIAQEAVHNAVKHARARNIRLSLKADGVLELAIQDDGIGMPLKATSFFGGLGLRIMKNRAAIIGAMLTIEPGAPSGTVVTCRLARKHDES